MSRKIFEGIMGENISNFMQNKTKNPYRFKQLNSQKDKFIENTYIGKSLTKLWKPKTSS